MESPRINIKTYFLLYVFVVGCNCARALPSSDLQSGETISSESSARALQLGMDTSNIIMWHSNLDIDALSAYTPSTEGGEQAECEHSYGFFPCSSTWSGSTLLFLMYGFMLFIAARLLSRGSMLMLTKLEPGLIGGILLPTIMTLPACFIILATIWARNHEEARAQALVSIGLVSGTTVGLLCVVWGRSIIVGRCDLDLVNGAAKDKVLTKGCSLTRTGVTTDPHTREGAWIMMLTLLPYLVLQFPVMLGGSQRTGHKAVLVALFLSLFTLAGYWIYQICFPRFQVHMIHRARSEHRADLLAQQASRPAETSSFDYSWWLEDGITPNMPLLEKVFKKFDSDGSGDMSQGELNGWLIAVGLKYEKEVLETWMKKLDKKGDGKISRQEFVNGMAIWIRELGLLKNDGSAEFQSFGTELQELDLSMNALLKEIRDEETYTPVVKTAVLKMIAGAIIAAIMANPVVDVIGDFSASTGIPPFYVSFVVLPFLLNLTEGLSSVALARRKRELHMNTIFPKIYGDVTMNNTMSLATFLAVFYHTGLPWNFSSEVLVILITFVAIGLIASVRYNFPLWIGFQAVILYPVLLVIVVYYEYIGHILSLGVTLSFPFWMGLTTFIVISVILVLVCGRCYACALRS